VKGLVDYWQGCLASGTPVDTEARMRSHDGAYRWFLFRANPLRDESGEIIQWFGTNIDVDDQKRAEQAVLASEQNLRLIVNTIPGFAWSASNDGEAEFINQQYLEFLGLSEEEARGWGWSSRVHPDDLNRLVSIWANARATGQPAEVEARHRRYDGEYRWLLVRTRPLRDAGGAVVKWYGVCADIEDRKRAEDALLARERSLNEIVNVIPTTAWTTRADGYCDFVNQGWLTYSGLSAEQAIGWGWGSILHPDDVGGLVEHWQFCLASGTPGDTEARMRRHDGEYRWFLFRANPLRDETGTIVKWIGTNIDIDDRKRAEEELRRSEAFLAKGQRLSMTGSLSWRVSTDEMVWSDEAYRIFECDPNLEVTPGLMFSRVHPEDVPTIDEMVKRARSSRRDFEFEFRLLMPDEKVKYVRLVAHGTRNHDGGLEYIGAVQDVTQRRLSDVAIGKARSELAHAARVMSLGTLTASIAHELNQPLSGIITNASTCLRMLAAVPPNVDGALETANRTIRDGNRASEVIVRLRALFEKKEVPPELVDMNDATREVIALLSTELQRKQVMLWPEFATDLPPAMGDRVQLQQVILNLLLNAADAMGDIKDGPKNVVIRTKLDGNDRVCVVVKDVGVGIDPLTANRLFDSFYTTKVGGMGIGLSVSRSIMESHRGHLWAESNDGPGATFTLAIPRMTDDEMGARFGDALRNSTEIVAQPLAGRS
jgi:PAS domain S-box-containing protein